MGYTPLYDHMLTGTLYGRWPHTGIWACLLSRASREGLIDEVPASIAAAIGVPVDLLVACINDFMQPDPGSRTKDHDGRRLELIDPNRDWGWRILNHGKYREKARKKDYDDQRTATGADAQRKQKDRESREVPRSPDDSRDDPLSEAEADKEKREGAEAPPTDSSRRTSEPKKRASKRCPTDFEVTSELREWARSNYPGVNLDRETAKFRDHEYKAAKTDWPAAWRTWVSKADDFQLATPARGNGSHEARRHKPFGG